MKKTHFLFLWLMLCHARLSAQAVHYPSAGSLLHGNQVKTMLTNGGDLFLGGFEADTASLDVSALFSSALWFGGYDQAGNLKTAGQTYRQSGSDFWPGPLNNAGNTDSITCAAWDKIWHAKGIEVRQFISDWNNGIFNSCAYSDLRK